MTSHIDPVRVTVIAAMVIVLLGVAYFEIRMIRNRRRRRETRGDAPDRANNVILSTKSIADAVARGGVRSLEADDLIREAETALKNRNYRVAIELADRAKALLRNEKAQYQAKGDLTKLEAAKPSGSDELTTKEKLAKEMPANYMQAKFSMNLAREEVDAARSRGRDVTEAERLLAAAQGTMDAQDYTAALAQASRVRHLLEATTVASPRAASNPTTPVSTVTTAKARPCSACGAAVPTGDTFCRKCGAPVLRPRGCASCGAEVAPEDAFCRKCGTKM